MGLKKLNPADIRRVESRSDTTPAKTTNWPISDLLILRSVMRRERTGEAVPERRNERHRSNFVLSMVEMCKCGVIRKAITRVVRTPEAATLASRIGSWRKIFGSISRPVMNMWQIMPDDAI